MSLAFNASVSGLNAATRTVGAVAGNIANAHSVSPYKVPRVDPVAPGRGTATEERPAPYRPVDVETTSVAGGGVAASVRARDPASLPMFDPGNPAADADGLVARPNVDYADEFVTLKAAQRAYEANLKAIEVEDEMLGALLDIRS